MVTLDLDRVADEIVPRGVESAASASGRAVLHADSPDAGNEAATALGLVSEAAAAIRELERESAQAVARAHDIAHALKEKIDGAESRAEQAEEALRQAESQVEELAATVEQTRNDFAALQSQLAAKVTELAVAQQRADHAEAAIQRIVDEIRTQLPVKLGIAAE